LAKIPWLVHGFSTRPGGVSDIEGEKSSKPRSGGMGRAGPMWKKTNAGFKQRSALPILILVSLHQIHSDVVRSVDSVPAQQCKGDALATDRSGLLLGVRTADCAPVLWPIPNKRVVAAIHAGWRGTLQRHRDKNDRADADGVRMPPGRFAGGDRAHDWRLLLRSWHRGRFRVRGEICERPPTFSMNSAPGTNLTRCNGST